MKYTTWVESSTKLITTTLAWRWYISVRVPTVVKSSGYHDSSPYNVFFSFLILWIIIIIRAFFFKKIWHSPLVQTLSVNFVIDKATPTSRVLTSSSSSSNSQLPPSLGKNHQYSKYTYDSVFIVYNTKCFFSFFILISSSSCFSQLQEHESR